MKLRLFLCVIFVYNCFLFISREFGFPYSGNSLGTVINKPQPQAESEQKPGSDDLGRVTAEAAALQLQVACPHRMGRRTDGWTMHRKECVVFFFKKNLLTLRTKKYRDHRFLVLIPKKSPPVV